MDMHCVTEARQQLRLHGRYGRLGDDDVEVDEDTQHPV